MRRTNSTQASVVTPTIIPRDSAPRKVRLQSPEVKRCPRGAVPRRGQAAKRRLWHRRRNKVTQTGSNVPSSLNTKTQASQPPANQP
jgi:hypothetical protein